MRKFISLVTIITMVFTLAGCSSQVEVLSKTDLFSKATEALANLKSYNLVIDINQKFSPKGEPEVINNGTLDINRFVDPFAVYFKAIMKNEQFDISEEMYIIEDSMYIHNNILDQWFKTTDSMRGTARGDIKIMTKAGTILEYMKQNENQVNMSEEEDNYKLTFDISSEDHNDFVITSLESYYPNIFKLVLLMSLMDDLKKDFTLNSSSVTLVLDKKTFYPLEFSFSVKHNSIAFNSDISVEQNYTGTYIKHNKIKEIKIPKDVIDEAIPMEAENN